MAIDYMTIYYSNFMELCLHNVMYNCICILYIEYPVKPFATSGRK